MKPILRDESLYIGMTLEQILNERQRTLATLERLLENVTRPETASRLGASIIATREEIESVRRCMEL